MTPGSPNDPNDIYLRDQPVWVIDDLLVKPGCQAAAMELMTKDYRDYGKARKLELVDVFALPPLVRPADPARLLVIWRYPTLDDLWQARYGEENDDWLKAFWVKIDALVLSRTRDLGRKSIMAGISLPDGKGIASPPPQSRRRQILFVKPGVELDDAGQGQWVEAAGSVVGSYGIVQSRAGFHSEFSYLPGQLTWDIESKGDVAPSVDALLAALPGPATASESAELGERLDAGFRETDMRSGLKRTIFFRAGDDLTEAQHGELVKALGDWSRHLPEIRNWTVSRIASCTGPIRWTYCSEQEFHDLDAIMGPYLNHPYHWAVIDRLFHRESPTQMAYEYTHTIRPISTSVLANIG